MIASPFRLRLGAVALAATLALPALAASPLGPLVEPSELRARLGEPGLVVLDIRSGETREAGALRFHSGHIPGAVHADYAHASWRLPREKVSVYLPEPAQFEALAGDLGIGNESHVVIVHEGSDATSFGAAARVYWTFKAMGHGAVSILNGGHQGWTRLADAPLATRPAAPSPALFEAKPVPSLRASLADVIAAEKAGETLVDSRPESFFTGLEKHRGVAAFGHIPGAVSVPHSRAFTADFRLKPRAELEAAFAAIGKGPAIAYCNTGHWAATDWFVLSEVLGLKDTRLYDGSMLEYAAETAGPIANPRGAPRS